MISPLRWAFPKSYRRIKELAQAAGVHEFEYRARVMPATDGGLASVHIERDGSEWVRSVPAADLEAAGTESTAFFAATVDAMAAVGQATYQEQMHHREV